MLEKAKETLGKARSNAPRYSRKYFGDGRS